MAVTKNTQLLEQTWG